MGPDESAPLGDMHSDSLCRAVVRRRGTVGAGNSRNRRADPVYTLGRVGDPPSAVGDSLELALFPSAWAGCHCNRAVCIRSFSLSLPDKDRTAQVGFLQPAILLNE